MRQRLDEESAEARRRLVTELLRLKECSGLSYEALAERTGYSRSSWQRFLNGGKPPTRAAVEQLADVAGGDRDRLLALWEYARETDDHLPTPNPQPEPATAPPTTPPTGTDAACPACRRPAQRLRPSSPIRAARWAAAALVLAAVAAVSVFLTARHLHRPDPADHAAIAAATATKAPAAPEPPATPQCRGKSCEGQEPTAMGCGRDATTLRTTWLVGLVVTLRHSPGCSAVWARIDNGTVGYQVRVSTPDGRSRTAEITWGQDVYTRMLATDTPGEAIACGVIPRHDEECTGKGTPAPTAP
ncbi:helix-turn-helix domain-containing protein [Streptomyces sp. NPDC053079]|uniref:helix-turn-helix domain-containing protein n=1 Tax=Streptomyces sp. NPDC053079 TaxID=3365697 RepID=UPI0037D0B079